MNSRGPSDATLAPSPAVARSTSISKFRFFKQKKQRDVHGGDRVFALILRALSWMTLFLLIALVVDLARLSSPAFAKFGFGFLTSQEWDPVNEQFGALPSIYGTLVSSLLALLISVPVSIGVALCLTEIVSFRWGKALGFLVEMLAAIPSVVYGLWGIFVLAPWMRTVVQPFLSENLGFIPLFSGPPMGVGMLTAAVILAIMITPTIASLCREVFRAIPWIYREAALGLGATRWEMIRVAVLTSSRSGILGAVALGLGRALGETMAVTMVIGNRAEISASLLAPGQTMASVIANEYAEAMGEMHLAALSGVGLTLLLVSSLLNFGARALIMRADRTGGFR